MTRTDSTTRVGVLPGAVGDPARPHIRVRVLGPLVVETDGLEIDLAGSALRRLVCRLALARGTAVPDAELLADVWGPSARIASLHTAVARVRRSVDRDPHPLPGRSVLERVPGGYRLNLAPRGLDADRFADAAAAGAATADPASAADLLRRALAEWRGAALSDVDHAPFADAEVARLHALRRDAEERLLECRLAVRDATAVADLEAFCRADPTREGAWEHLAAALAQDGRTAEALRSVRLARRLLVESTGMGLGPRLERVQAALLRHEVPVLEPEPAPAALLPGAALPVPLGRLVGAEAPIAAVLDLLAECRLVTLTGPGGVGKTRIAIEAAGRRRDDDGPWFVELADVHDGALVPETIGRALGLAGVLSADPLRAALRDRLAVLVLDNCEHLAGPVQELVTDLLLHCPGLRVLATSRSALGVPGERVLPIAPLPLGADGAAVRLFAMRAAESGTADATGDDVVAAICERLDGLPLAIELAAARTAELAPDDLLGLLDDRFALLQRASGHGRHSTLQATVDWSFQRLGDVEQRAFEVLSVFAGGFTLPAATAVLGREDAPAIVARLAAASMVQVVGGRPRRYRLLETLREFADRSIDHERRQEAERRHVSWVVSLTAGMDRALRGRLGSVATAELPAESANIRAALARAGWRDVLRIAGGFYWYWYREGLVAEGLDAMSAALAAADASGEALDEADCARAAMGIALLSYLAGDRSRVGDALARADQGAVRSGDPRVRTQQLSTLAYFEAGGGDVEAALRHGTESLELAESLGDEAAAAECLMVLGETARRRGDAGGARELLGRAVARADAAGYTWAALSSTWIASKAALGQGRPAEARALAADSAARAAATGERTSWMVGLVTVAHVDLLAGDVGRAAVLAGAAAHLGARTGFSPASLDPEVAAWTAPLDAALADPALRRLYDTAGIRSPDDLAALLAGSPLQ